MLIKYSGYNILPREEWQLLAFLSQMVSTVDTRHAQVAAALLQKSNRVQKALVSVNRAETSGRHVQALTRALTNYLNTSITGWAAEAYYMRGSNDIRIHISNHSQTLEYVVNMASKEVTNTTDNLDNWIPIVLLYGYQ